MTAPSTQRYGIVVCNATMRTSTIRSAPDDFILSEDPNGAAFWLARWLELALMGMVRLYNDGRRKLSPRLWSVTTTALDRYRSDEIDSGGMVEAYLRSVI